MHKYQVGDKVTIINNGAGQRATPIGSIRTLAKRGISFSPNDQLWYVKEDRFYWYDNQFRPYEKDPITWEYKRKKSV